MRTTWKEPGRSSDAEWYGRIRSSTWGRTPPYLLILRAAKNRCLTNEIGIFEMQSGGLQVLNWVVFPEEMFRRCDWFVHRSDLWRDASDFSGGAALVTPTMFGNAKLTTTGLDFLTELVSSWRARKRAGFLSSKSGCYLKSAGGVSWMSQLST